MLIVNADDWGMSRVATDNTLSCFRAGGITSASAMVFMIDSARAAELALEAGMDTGLHLNLTQPFDGDAVSAEVAERQRRLVRKIGAGRFRSLWYHPLLRQEFAYLFRAQYEEYTRLYGKPPSHIDGHHHMHLCPNVLADRLIPAGSRVRRSFTFRPGEQGSLHRLYRWGVDRVVTSHYRCTDEFYAFAGRETLPSIVDRSRSRHVEIMIHPERQYEFRFLMTAAYLKTISRAVRIPYCLL